VNPETVPIHAVLPDVLRSLAAQPRLVLEAPPGAGKTTRVPPALLVADWLGDRRVVMLEPRRIAARAAAEFMAAEFGEAVGQRVGYRIRFESRMSAATRIEVVTEGILTRMLQDDPELPGVGAILFDEFHERHLQGDLAAALALDVQANLRPELRLLIMSATLDGERIARWFDAPRISSAGRSFPVRVEYPPARADEAWPARGWSTHVRRAIGKALAETRGDVLVFLPGKREIERMRGLIADDAEVVALHGDLALAAQHAALAAAAPGERRVVLATNVAESSLTLPGIGAVVDPGLAREPRFDPGSGFTRLATVPISQASADQRAGRAGRTGPGVAYRLWPESRRLDASRTPEIAQVELSQLALELAAWGSDALAWLDPPPPGALAQARELLQTLDAFDAAGHITATGRRMLRLGMPPRLGAMVLHGTMRGGAEATLACAVAALVEGRNPLRGEVARNDDFRVRVAALDAWRARDHGALRAAGADSGALAAIAQVCDATRRRLDVERTDGRAHATDAAAQATAVGDLLAHAFPDRIARQDPANPRRYRLANGRGAHLGEDTALFGEPWLVAIDLRLDARDSLILAAAPFDPGVLERDFPQRFRSERVQAWNDERGRVEAFEEQRFDAIVLERRTVAPNPDDVLPALIGAIRARGLDALPWSEAACNLRLRVQALRGWCPELALPDFSDAGLHANLDEWLAPALAGKTRLDALRSAELSNALASRLDYAQRAALDELAPAVIRVPSGRERAIRYEPDGPPVLAVKLQELFGLADTPRIARGRVALSLHLLSPAGRPIQVTADLASFWQRTYPEVRRELKGRYPRHPWPEDPWSATPTARPRPRGT
jgi:ATP-dependent helicase HrpB